MLHLVSHILLVIGVVKRSCNFLIPYLSITAITLGLVSIPFIIVAIGALMHNEVRVAMFVLVQGTGVWQIVVCCFTVVLSHYNELRNANGHVVIELQEPGNQIYEA